MSKKILSIVLILFIASGFSLYAKAPDGWNANKEMTNILAKMTQYDEVKRTILNVGNWLYWVANDGVMGYNAATQQSGGLYPKGKGAVVYTEGLVYGGYVDENGNGQLDPDADRLSVGGTTYGTALQCGWINEAGEAVPLNKVWRIRTDWETLTPQDVAYEAEQLGIPPEEVIAQYEYDWKNWPTELGAPYYDNNNNGEYDEGDEPGVANADQVIWFVANDLNKGLMTSFYGSEPIGLEIQNTLWAYAQPTTELGQIIFKKYTVINKSGKDVLDAYVSQFVDPDVGSAGNDFIGCDTSLSLGYGYNGTPTDPSFPDMAPPAVGFDFFQGPIVEAPGHTANWNFGKREGYKNLPMTTFGWFAAGSNITDPTLGGDYEGTKQWYNLLKGYKPFEDLAEPEPWTVGNVTGGQETKFPLCGDPVNDPASKRIDGQGNYFQPGDRRMSLASGPFTLAAADTQEIVLAVVGGSGANRLASIIQVKQTDEMAQLVYNNAFKEIPAPPDRPDVSYITDEDAVVLEWGSNHDAVQSTETKVKSGYEFEGYNVYQFPSSMASLDDATKIATYDVINSVTKIMGTKYISEYGGVSQIPVQVGTNTGIKRHIEITKDHISGYRLYEGRTYYFGVTAYNYNPDADQIKQLESAPVILEVRVEEPDPGTERPQVFNDTLDVAHPVGKSDGQVIVKVINPEDVTGHEYEITFEEDTDTNSTTYGEVLWNLQDKTTGEWKVEDELQISDITAGEDCPIVDGVQVKVAGPAPGVKGIYETDAEGNVVDNGVSYIEYSLGSTGFIMTGLDGGNFDRFDLLGIHDYIIDFTGESVAWQYFDDIQGGEPTLDEKVPFALYQKAFPSGDMYRMFPAIFDRNTGMDATQAAGAGVWDTTGTNYFGVPAYEPIFGYKSVSGQYDPADESDYNSANEMGEPPSNTGWGDDGNPTGYPIINYWYFEDYLGGGLPIGNKVYVQTNKPIQTNEVYTFNTQTIMSSDSLAKADVEKINVFPNPYYANNGNATDRFQEYVTFTHLPQKAEIRIFNLKGVLVEYLEKDNNNQFVKWDLTNTSDLPVGSGIYIANIKLPDLGMSKNLKIAVIQKKQILKYF
ncbi:MAG TPA: hypothetical protein VKP78_08910 [bacterium]|nr:hypothetical protein [bacterium]